MAIKAAPDCAYIGLQLLTKENPMRLGTTCTALAIFAGSTAIADAGQYELRPTMYAP
jgi:hypothetical protein